MTQGAIPHLKNNASYFMQKVSTRHPNQHDQIEKDIN